MNLLFVRDANADARCNLSSGGTLTSYESAGVLYCVSTFTSNGTFQWNGTNATIVDVVLVGGGGGGGHGGGGSGGVIQAFLPIDAQSHSITVGQGGVANDSANTNPGGTGGDSSAFGLVARGGAGGGGYGGYGTAPGATCSVINVTTGATATINIGCGGGGAGASPPNSNFNYGGSGGSPGGYAGGDGLSSNGDANNNRGDYAGGGGGAGGKGGNGDLVDGGWGGAAVATTITSPPLSVASGGNAYNSSRDVATYVGSGGNGVTKSNRNGADGIVIVRYQLDITAPTVSSVSVPSDGSYKAGDTLSFTVNTSENVTVVTTGGTPQIALTIGSTTRQATYASGTGTSALVFSYTVQASETDTDGIAVGTLSANGGTLKDAAGNDMNLTLNSVGSTAAILVDTTAPNVSIQNAPTAVNSTSPFSVTFKFSEDVSGFDKGDILVTNGSAGNFTTTDANTYSADITPDAGGNIAINISDNIAQDAASNNNIAATQVTVAYDITAPTAPTIGTSNGSTLSGTAESGATVTIYATDGTTVLATTTADGNGDWSITNPLSDGETGSITVTDSAGNTSSALVISANAPVADAGSNQTVSSAATVTLDGSGSSDADGNSITYAWSQTSGTSVTLSSSTASQPTFTAPTIDSDNTSYELVFSLTVTDSTGRVSSADTVTITVSNNTPTADAGPDQTVAAGATVTLDGTGSSDADSNSLNYAWTQTSGTTVTLSSSTASQPTFTAPTAASTTTLIFSLVVTDSIGDASSADTVTITVNPLDPTVAFNQVKSKIDTLVNDAAFTSMQNHHQVTNTLSSAAVNRAMNNSCGTFKDQYYANVNSNSDSSTAKGKLTWSSIKDTSRYVKHQSIEFIHRDLEDGPNTSHLSFTLQWEDCTRDTFLWGYFAGAQAENSDLENSTFRDGEYNSTGLKIGSYFVKSLHQNAYWNGIISAPYNFNKMTLNTSLMHASSDYETKMISAGTGLTGKVTYKFITFKPNVNLRYSSHQSERVKFIASVGSQQSDNFIDLDRLEQITLRVRSSFILALNQSNPEFTPATLTIDPELSCDQKVVGTNTQRCTQGVSISFSQIFSNDFEVSLETGVQSNNDRNTHHFRTNIQIPF